MEQRCGTLPLRFDKRAHPATMSHQPRLYERRGATDPTMTNEPPTKFPLRLPNGGSAIVSEAKIRDYLLSPTHPIVRFKAVFFSALGYTIDNWERLQADLLKLAESGEVFARQESPYGQKYEVR